MWCRCGTLHFIARRQKGWLGFFVVLCIAARIRTSTLADADHACWLSTAGPFPLLQLPASPITALVLLAVHSHDPMTDILSQTD